MTLYNKINTIRNYFRAMLVISLLVFISISTLSAQNPGEDRFPYDQNDREEAPLSEKDYSMVEISGLCSEQ